MASKYKTQRQNAEKRRYRIKKATEGVTFPEEIPEGNAWDIVEGGAEGFGMGSSIAGKVPNPYAKAALMAGGAIFGVGKAVFDQRQAKVFNKKIRQMKESYEKYGNKATDAKLQMAQAKTGNKGADSKLIEIETNEIHTDRNFNLKNIGKTPHKKGKNKPLNHPDIVDAKEGDVIFDSQNPKKRDRIMNLIKRYKGGDTRAYKMLEKERQQLPKDKGTQKAQGGLLSVVSPEEENVLNLPSTNYTNPWNFSSVLDEEFDMGVPADSPYNYTISENTEPINDGYEPQIVDPAMEPAMQDVLTQSLSGNPFNASSPIHQFMLDNQDITDFKTLQKKAESSGIDPDAFSSFLDTHYNKGQAVDVGSGVTGGRGYGQGSYRNLEQMNLDAMLRYVNDYNAAMEDYLAKKNKPVDEPVNTPEILPEPTQDVVATPEQKTEDPAPTEEAVNRADPRRAYTGRGGKYANIMHNFLRSMQSPEQFNLIAPSYKKFMHQDLTAPLLQEINKSDAVNKFNINRTHGSRGQKVSYLTQADAKKLAAKHRVQTEEIGRRIDSVNRNVALDNRAEDMITADQKLGRDVMARRRAATRRYADAAYKEMAERAQIDEQADYMKSRDEKQQKVNELLASVLGSRSYEFSDIYDEDGNIKDDVKTQLKEAFQLDEETPKQEKGNKSVKVKNSRYVKR